MEQFLSIKNFETHHENICDDTIRCKQLLCAKIHPRCFVGVCLPTLVKNEKQCIKGTNCKLRHFDKQAFKTEVNLGSINGIYRYNICNQKNCENEEICQFLHIEWTKKYCLEYLIFQNCKQQSDHNHNKLEHKDWDDVKNEVHEFYNKNKKLNPENLCLKNNCSGECLKHLNNDQVCLFYFKGICLNLKCPKTHCMWEDYDQKGKIVGEKLISCYEKHGIAAEIKYEHSDLYIRNVELIKLKDEIKQQNRIDIIFIMDCTESMQAWIKQSSDQINTLIDEFKNYLPDSNSIKVGFVGYRDTCDGNQQFQQIDLTNDIKKVRFFIQNLKASGGGDQAEDVYGAILKAQELQISKYTESILITFLFADAPTHGKQYHEQNIGDFQNNTIPDQQLEKLMQNYSKLKKRNFFYCVAINRTTDKMYEIMQKNFTENQLTITETIKPEKFKEVVRLNLQQSLIKTKTIDQRKYTEINADFYKPKDPSQLVREKNETKLDYWKSFPQQKVLNFLRSGPTSVKIFEVCVDEGQECKVYELRDSRNFKTMYAKIQKSVIQEYQTNGKLKESTKKTADQFAYSRFLRQTIAKQLAWQYRMTILKVKKQKDEKFCPIYYVTPVVYQLKEEFMGLKLLYAESFINQDITWIKYTNNDDIVNKEYYYFTSFSHFAYQETEKLFVVTDLQGKSNIFSDPSIHTSKDFCEYLQQDKTNAKMDGIATFEQLQHKNCSIICQRLGLEPLNKNQQYDKKVYILDPKISIFLICDYCDRFTQADDFTEIHKCYVCQEIDQVQDNLICKCCKESFKTSYDMQYQKATEILRCHTCKQKCNVIEQKCHYCQIYCKQKVFGKQVNDKQLYLCEDAFIYLNSLYCRRCNKQKYDYKTLIELNSYRKGDFICKGCQSA